MLLLSSPANIKARCRKATFNPLPLGNSIRSLRKGRLFIKLVSSRRASVIGSLSPQAKISRRLGHLETEVTKSGLRIPFSFRPMEMISSFHLKL